MAMKFDEMMAAKKSVEATAQLIVDPEWARAVADAAGKVKQAENDRNTIEMMRSIGDSTDASTLAEQLADADDKIVAARDAHAVLLGEKDDKMVVLKFRALSAVEYDALVATHRPTPDQKAEAKRAGLNPPMFNVDTFPLALVQATLVDPAWSADELKQLWEDPRFNAAELRALYTAADAATSGWRMVDLGEG